VSSNQAPAKRGGSEPPFDPTSWHGALLVMCLAGALLWVVQIIDANRKYTWVDRFGLRPREVGGLWGIGFGPVLHASYGHLLSDTVPFVLIGWVVLLSGVRTWLTVTAAVIVLGGVLTWLVGPSHAVIVGSSTIVMGWLGYLLARAYFSRRLKWILTAILVLFFFGTLLGSLLPSFGDHSAWQAHVCGFVAGVAVAWVLHPRHRRRSGSPKGGVPAVS
jgi:membrane associated rhomboid family serine protease